MLFLFILIWIRPAACRAQEEVARDSWLAENVFVGRRTWRHVTVNVGFEGIYWTIWGLTVGSPILWDHDLYTAHGSGLGASREGFASQPLATGDHGLDGPSTGP